MTQKSALRNVPSRKKPASLCLNSEIRTQKRPERGFPEGFFEQRTLSLARRLLGATLSTYRGGEKTSGRIVEVEAYCGPRDAAAHSFHGRTARTEVMFWGGGYCYVYFIYGAHYCVNVVTGRKGAGEAVLIRALEPLEGLDIMQRRRGNVGVNVLANGPGKLCKALGIDRTMYGEHYLRSKLIRLEPADAIPARCIGRSQRIGISAATDKLWRFYLKGNACLSRPEKQFAEKP